MRPKPQFYCHFDKQSLSITGITTREVPADTDLAIQLDYDLAVKFLGGAEDPTRWVIGKIEGHFALEKLSDVTVLGITDRLELSDIIELDPSGYWPKDLEGLPDIIVTFNHAAGTIDVKYNGSVLKISSTPLRLYITQRDDPTHLLGAYTICPATLDAIMVKNELAEWPNPVKIAVPAVDDVSVFVLKSLLTIASVNQRRDSANEEDTSN